MLRIAATLKGRIIMMALLQASAKAYARVPWTSGRQLPTIYGCLDSVKQRGR
jgi:hypothetical protein